jgi:hypothetical protein
MAWRSRSLSFSRFWPSKMTSPPRGLVQAQQGQAHGRLARTRLAHHAQRVALAQLEVDVLHGLELALAEQALLEPEALGQRAHLQHHRGVRVLGLADLARLAAGDVVVDHHQPRRVAFQAGPAGQQGLGVGVLRAGEDAGHVALLAHLAVAHHHHLVGDLAHQPRSWLMNSTLMRRSVFSLRQQFEDLALDGHVQRRGRLVGDQQLGLAGQRHGDHHALLLAAATSRAGSCPGGAWARGCPPRPAAPRRAPAPRAAQPRCLTSGSHSCWPTVNTGLSEDIGSWKTQAISLPRSPAVRRRLASAAGPGPATGCGRCARRCRAAGSGWTSR